jgi:enterochelin esterase-like enzyme
MNKQENLENWPITPPPGVRGASTFFTTETAGFQGFEFITVKSNALKKRADITVFKPKGYTEYAGVTILLHGVYGSHWAWSVKGNVHTTTQQLIDSNQIKPMILVMPSDGLFGDGSAYLPHKTENYETWIVEDLMQVIKEQIPEINVQTPIFITGLSMGGYGAMRLAAKYPEKFKAFSGLSSITDFHQMALFVADFEDLENKVLSKDSVIEWMIKNKESLPPFRFDCGKEDLLIEHNRLLHNDLVENNIPHFYEEFEGAHPWEYWEKHIAKSLIFFNKFC